MTIYSTRIVILTEDEKAPEFLKSLASKLLKRMNIHHITIKSSVYKPCHNLDNKIRNNFGFKVIVLIDGDFKGEEKLDEAYRRHVKPLKISKKNDKMA